MAALHPGKKLIVSDGPTEEALKMVVGNPKKTVLFFITTWRLVARITEVIADEGCWLVRGEGAVLGTEHWVPFEGIYAPHDKIGQLQCM